jgi:tetratricopeptide (TPR) repeat protein
MMVKNESKVIARAINSVKKYIDTWVILDTGSTDDTVKVVYETLKGIPGTLVRKPFINFAVSRTSLLRYADKAADYLILMDADEQYVFKDTFNKDKLDADMYSIPYEGNLGYSVPKLIKGDKEWEYVGVTHEYLSCRPGVNNHGFLNDLSLIHHADGGCKSDKFTRDIKLLEQGLVDEPKNSRYMFYLANSYKDNGNFEKAVEYYNKTIQANGWEQEITCAYEYKGFCLEALGKQEEALKTYLLGYNFNRSRAECIYNAARIYRQQGLNVLAYVMAEIAKKIKMPSPRALFVKKNVYDHLIDYELAVSAYYYNKYLDMRDSYKKLLFKTNLDYNNLIANYKFYSKPLSSLLSRKVVVDFNSLEFSPYYNNSSPCIIEDATNDSTYIVNLRQVNYEVQPDGSYTTKGLDYFDKIQTQNIIFKFDKEFTPENREVLPLESVGKKVSGVEDLKLYFDNDYNLKFTGTVWQDYKDIKVASGYVDKQDLKTIHPSPTNSAYEKNWVPFRSNLSANFVYSWAPLVILKEQENSNTLENAQVEPNTEFNLRNIRGSSPGTTYGNYIWFLVHCVEYSTPRHYYHAVVILDKNTNKLVDISRLFTFNKDAKIEYALGFLINNKEVIISHSTNDKDSCIVTYSTEEFINFIGFDNYVP